MWGEISQHQPAAGPVGAVSTPGGSLCHRNAETIEYAVKYEVFFGIYIVVLSSACLLKCVILRDTQKENTH